MMILNPYGPLKVVSKRHKLYSGVRLKSYAARSFPGRVVRVSHSVVGGGTQFRFDKPAPLGVWILTCD